MSDLRFLAMVLGFGAVAALIEVLIARLTPRRRWPKYMPAVLAFVLAASCLVKAIWFASGWEDLAFAALAVLTIGIGIVALVAAIVIDVAAARRARRAAK